jgi:hypothetical protein
MSASRGQKVLFWAVVVWILGTFYVLGAGINSGRPRDIPGGSEAGRDSILRDIDSKLARYDGIPTKMEVTDVALVVTVAPAFYDLSFDQKKSFITLLARRAGRGDMIPVSIRDYYSGREVASWGPFGFKLH